MDGVSEDLVGLGEVFPSALGRGEVLAGGGFLGQARDSFDERLAIAIGVVAPLDASGQRSAACRIGSPRSDGGG